jgi:formate dehydrogenase subunit beta
VGDVKGFAERAGVMEEIRHCIIERPDGDVRGALVGLLRAVLGSGMADALLVPLRHPAGDALAPALVKDPALLDLADPLAPVLPLNGARLVSLLTQRPPRPRLAAVLRNCEIRALVELVKLQQASLEGLVLIGVECTGTYEVKDYARIASGEPRAAFALRPACQMCEYPAPALSESIPGLEMVIRQIGLEGAAALHVEASAAWAARLGLTAADDAALRGAAAHEAALRQLLVEHSATRERMLAEVRARTATPEGLAAFFSTCIRCHNCMTNCPICYCKTCFFKTEVFDHDPTQFVAWATRKGATRLPGDTLLFHLTRMNHMSTSCVGCGLCTSACPAGIPVGSAFRSVAERTQALFGYVPGRSLDEAPPVKTFEVNELGELGEG